MARPPRTRLPVFHAALLLSLAIAAVGCTEGAGPAPGSTIVSVQITPANARLCRGASLRVAATAIYSNGYRQDATSQARWRSSNPRVAAIGTNGVITAIGYGATQIMTTVSGTTGSTQLVVEPTTIQGRGPLRIDPDNPRYFADGTGRAIYLTGSHTWTNFQDSGVTDPPPRFRYSDYLDFLGRHNHNFFRLWVWEQANWNTETTGDYWFQPLPFRRTGPGLALDGKPKFDLNKFNQAYFDRLRERVTQAGERGIYVAVMLFNGWSIEDKNQGRANPWRGHPLNRDNNVNAMDGDPDLTGQGTRVHTLTIPAIVAVQERYVKKVIDTVNDLDNVLYEISNESTGSTATTRWQYHMIDFVKSYEKGKPKQHPVGMTAEWPHGSDADLFASPADWISPKAEEHRLDNPPVANGQKVIIYDTDHICGHCGTPSWVWKSFLRGLYPVFMDTYDGSFVLLQPGPPNPMHDPKWNDIRRALGMARAYARKVNLTSMVPRNEMASTGYCLANEAGAEYLVYLPSGGNVTVNLTAVTKTLSVEWLSPDAGVTMGGGTVAGGGKRVLGSPFGKGEAVLYIH